MEALHRLLLRLVHFKFTHRHFVLVALAAGLHLIPNVNIRAAASEALLEKNFIVTDLELVCCESEFVILEIFFFAIVGVSLPVAIGALRASIFVTV